MVTEGDNGAVPALERVRDCEVGAVEDTEAESGIAWRDSWRLLGVVLDRMLNEDEQEVPLLVAVRAGAAVWPLNDVTNNVPVAAASDNVPELEEAKTSVPEVETTDELARLSPEEIWVVWARNEHCCLLSVSPPQSFWLPALIPGVRPNVAGSGPRSDGLEPRLEGEVEDVSVGFPATGGANPPREAWGVLSRREGLPVLGRDAAGR
jgi:hypothetical protein